MGHNSKTFLSKLLLWRRFLGISESSGLRRKENGLHYPGGNVLTPQARSESSTWARGRQRPSCQLVQRAEVRLLMNALMKGSARVAISICHSCLSLWPDAADGLTPHIQMSVCAAVWEPEGPCHWERLTSPALKHEPQQGHRGLGATT